MSDIQGFPTQRRGSIPPGTSPATSLFQRRGSLAVGMAPPPMFASSPSSSASGDAGHPGHRRHMSVSASLGLATSPTAAFDFRRSSTSTSADSVAESSGSAIDDDDRSAPLQFARRLSVQPARAFGGGGGPVSAGAASPIADQGLYDWGAHLRARAQSSVSGTRPVFGTSPPRDPAALQHRQSQASAAASRPDPPAQAAPPAPPRPQRAKPDAYQERILKGDFYMD